MRQETDSMCRMECFSVLFTKFYYFLLILKIISWNWLAILHLYPRWSSQQHIYILFTLSSFFVCLHISPQTEGVRTLQIMSKTSHRAKIHRTGGRNPTYRVIMHHWKRRLVIRPILYLLVAPVTALTSWQFPVYKRLVDIHHKDIANHKSTCIIQISFMIPTSGIMQVIGSANKRRRCSITSSLIGWAHIENDPCTCMAVTIRAVMVEIM